MAHFKYNNKNKKKLRKKNGILDYEIEADEQEKVEQLVSQLKAQFLQLNVKSKILNEKADKDKYIAKLLQVFSDHAIQIQNKKTNPDQQEDYILESPKTILKEYISKEIQSWQIRTWAVKQLLQVRNGSQISVGNKFETIKNYTKLGSQQQVSVEQKPGQILLVIYWAKWFPACLPAVKSTSKFLKKYTFGDKVRVVALSLLKCSDIAGEYLHYNAHLQEHIEFHFPQEDHQLDINLYGVRYYPDQQITDIPHYVIIDKFGVVRACGTQNSLENITNSLLEEDNPAA